MASNYLAKGLKRSALTVALGLCFAGSVHAQSTTGGVTGTAPAGTTIVIANNSGLTRTVTADANGRYSASSLPVGAYTVTSGGVERKIVVTVGGNTTVSFGSGTETTLETVTVTASNVPSIDVTTTDTRTIITAEDLKRLPMPRSAESIALLSPGAVVGNGAFFGDQISFGGSSVAENAYYLNGYFSGNPMTNVGGFTLPYGSIEQQETYTGGYGARFGRSSGGVISQVGKSGSNDWTFGGQVVWTPKATREVRPDRFMPELDLPPGYSYTDEDQVGVAYDKGKDRLSWNTVYSAYIGGPIIKDRLFFFLSAETTETDSQSPGGNPDVGFSKTATKTSASDPKLYSKINWNITDNHLLEATYVAEKYEQEGSQYNFDWDTYQYGTVRNPSTGVRQNDEFSIVKYTGYLTNNLTLSATWGHSRQYYNETPYLTGSPFISSAGSQNPALNNGTPRNAGQAAYRAVQNARTYTDGLRAELEWVLGDHTLTGGLDWTELEGADQGWSQVADAWVYGKVGNENANLSSSLGVGPTGIVPGSCNGTPNQANANGTSTNCGYNVYRLRYFDSTSMSNKQKAYYLEDKWQISDNFLLTLGLRADTYQNFSDAGTKFVDSGTQWQPRVGFAWDVNGDSSFKVFGNGGRYFLNMPNAVAIRGVSASTFTREYYTYTGINADGTPTGLTAVNGIGTGAPAGPVSSNGELGTPKDPLTYVPNDIKSQYQDEFVLGFEHTLTDRWSLGAKLTRRELKSAIDDFCDPYSLVPAAGLDMMAYDSGIASFINKASDGKLYAASYCYMFNPGGSNTYAFAEVKKKASGVGYEFVPGSYYTAELSSDELGFPGLKRTYSALDLFVERKWDGKWGLRVDYTFSKSMGNSEGPANSDTGQGSNSHSNGVATSQNWDAWQIMQYAYGYLPNDRRHQLKARGAYAITPEWTVSANVNIASGAPISCFGYYDPDGSIDHSSPEADPIGYHSSYHTCFGETSTPGKTTAPWTQRWDMGLVYKPAFLDHKLAIGLNAFNIFNSVKATSYQTTAEDDGPYSIGNDFMLPVSFNTPRYLQLTISYDY